MKREHAKDFEAWHKAEYPRAGQYEEYGEDELQAAFAAGLSAGEARGYEAGVEAATKVLHAMRRPVRSGGLGEWDRAYNTALTGAAAMVRSLNSPAETGEDKED